MTQNKAFHLLKRRENNLAFFQRHYPDIYKHFANYQLTKAEVVISNSEDEVDLYYEGRSLYEGQGKARAHQGVELFKATFAEGTLLPSQPPPWPGVYRHPRFAHSAIDRIANQSPLNRAEFRGYPIPNFYPLVVFQGVGLGFQVEELITTTDVENAVILEPNLDIFAASLLTVDWEKVCTKFQRPERSLRFLIGVEYSEDTLWRSLMYNLMYLTPIFPIMNLFINERGDPLMDAAAKRLNREAMASLTTWGHYDDEIRQLNNALHAFHEGIKVIPPKNSIRSDIPVLVVGSGPSLDGRMPDIKAVRDNVIVVSAGTGLRALIENDIFPDFHVELESDYINYRVISSYDKEKLKSIRIIAASQICPLIWNLFGDQRLYFKKENPIGSLFGTPETNISSGAPTCTNAAIALCSQLGLRNIFLFGTDFGFQSHDQHHSKSSIYMDNQDNKIGTELKKDAAATFNKSRTFQVPGVNNMFVHTTPTYFTAKRATEDLIKSTQQQRPDVSFSNCADGAEIEGANWTSGSEFLEKAMTNASTLERENVVNQIFSDDAQEIPLNQLNERLTETHDKLKQLGDDILSIIKHRRIRGKKDITRLCSEISRYSEIKLQKKDSGFYFMIRGTIRHFLYAGFSHALAMNDSDKIAKFLEAWRAEFTNCLQALPEHFSTVTSKNYSLDSDPWVRQSIDDPEDA